MSENIESVVKRIHLFNQLWKTFQERYGNKHVLTNMLVQQKSDLQNSLIRDYQKSVVLSLDKEVGDGIVSICINTDVSCPWKDAAHIPIEHLEYQFHSLVHGDS